LEPCKSLIDSTAGGLCAVQIAHANVKAIKQLITFIPIPFVLRGRSAALANRS
jgi:hypothetical protein